MSMKNSLNNIAFKDILYKTDDLFDEVMSEETSNLRITSYLEAHLYDELEFSIDEIRQIIDEEIFE
jgi:hypothetical protein